MNPRHCVAILLFALSGCGPGGTSEFLSLGTAGTGGVYYPLGGAIASSLSIADSARQFTAEVSGGSVENINRLAEGQIDLAFSLSVSAYQGYHAEGDFTTAVDGLRVLAPLYPNVSHIVVPGNSEARSIADLRGAKISVGSAGSGTEQISRHLLAAHGISYEEVEPRYLTFNESATALRDGAIDAAMISVGYPAAAILEVSTTSSVRILPVDPAVIEEMRADHPYYNAGELPAGVYPGVEVPIPTLIAMNWIVGLESVPDEVVTNLLGILRDRKAALEAAHDMARLIDLANLEHAPIPLHPATSAWMEGR